MYISVAESRAKGFLRWADAHEPEKIADTRAKVKSDGVVATPDLEGISVPSQRCIVYSFARGGSPSTSVPTSLLVGAIT